MSRNEKIATVAPDPGAGAELAPAGAQLAEHGAGLDRRAPRPRLAGGSGTAPRRRTSPRRARTPSRRRRPARAPRPAPGPANSATVATIAVAALASCSSDSGTVCGTSPVNAGRKNASAAPKTASITTMCQISTVPVRIRTASSACIAARTRSVATITRCRGSRSAHTPPSIRNATNGMAWAASTIPTSVGDPISVTYSASATNTSRSPIVLALCPSQSKRNSRSRRTRRIDQPSWLADGRRRALRRVGARVVRVAIRRGSSPSARAASTTRTR